MRMVNVNMENPLKWREKAQNKKHDCTVKYASKGALILSSADDTPNGST